MTSYEMQYRDLTRTVLAEGKWVYNKRTGKRCLTIPRYEMRIDLDKHSAPLLQGRPSYPVSAVAEIIGYLRRLNNAQDFADIGSPTWFTNANETQSWLDNPVRKGKDDLGVVYGAALSEEYIASILTKIKNNEDDRGLILDWWQPDSFDKGCLRPCMSSHQFSLIDGEVNLTSTSRSVDVMCGLNFNSIQTYFLGMLACKLSGLKGGNILHVLNHVHIYEDHIEGVEEYLNRTIENTSTEFSLQNWVGYGEDVTLYTGHARDYFKLEGYKGVAQPKIDFELVA